MGSRNLKESSVSYLKDLNTGVSSILKRVWNSLLKTSDAFWGQLIPSKAPVEETVCDHDTGGVFVYEDLSEEQPCLAAVQSEEVREVAAEGQTELFEELYTGDEDKAVAAEAVAVQEIFEQVPLCEGPAPVQDEVPVCEEGEIVDFLPPMSEPTRRAPARMQQEPACEEVHTEAFEVQELITETAETEIAEVFTTAEAEPIHADEPIGINVTIDLDSFEMELSQPIVAETLEDMTVEEITVEAEPTHVEEPIGINVAIDLDSFEIELSQPIVAETLEEAVIEAEPTHEDEPIGVNVAIDLDSFEMELSQPIVAETVEEMTVEAEPIMTPVIEMLTAAEEETEIPVIEMPAAEEETVEAEPIMIPVIEMQVAEEETEVPVTTATEEVVFDLSALVAETEVSAEESTEAPVAEASLLDVLTPDVLAVFDEKDSHDTDEDVIEIQVQEDFTEQPIEKAAVEAAPVAAAVAEDAKEARGGIAFSFFSPSRKSETPAITFTFGKQQQEEDDDIFSYEMEETDTVVREDCALVAEPAT